MTKRICRVAFISNLPHEDKTLYCHNTANDTEICQVCSKRLRSTRLNAVFAGYGPMSGDSATRIIYRVDATIDSLLP